MNQPRKMKKVRIYGAGGHSQVIREVLEEDGYEITATFDDKPSGRHFASKNVNSGARKILEEFQHKGDPVIIAVGINADRSEIAAFLRCDYEKVIHKSTIIDKTSKIGIGTVVFAGAIIQPNTVIGKHVIINTAASIDHDNIIGDFAHISPKAALCGHVEVGEGSHIGVGAVVIPKVKIGKWCTIGAGTVVLNDVPDYSTIVGNPGKIIKTKKLKKVISSKTNVSDITFIGSGISSTFTLLNFLDLVEASNMKKKVAITIIDKYQEYHTGIPYGNRSGTSTLLITSLQDFLPEPEQSKFIAWLNNNKNWLLDELIKNGGTLSKGWISRYSTELNNNDWKKLFIPRRFFGWYINEKIELRLKELIIEGLITVNHVNAEVLDLKKNNSQFKIILDNGNNTNSKKVVLAVGSLPVNYIWKDKSIIKKRNLLFINDPYGFKLKTTMNTIKSFLEETPDRKINVLIVGANASALEMIYQLNDIDEIRPHINNFTFISRLGLLPDALKDNAEIDYFLPSNLDALKNSNKITADVIANATYKDLEDAKKLKIKAASTTGVISQFLSVLLNKLDKKELKKFTCVHGTEIGRRQRCAGYYYLKTIEELRKENRFNHIAGRFNDIKENGDNEYLLEYLDTKSEQTITYKNPIHLVINCVGNIKVTSDKAPELIKNLIKRGYSKPNATNVHNGFEVNDSLESTKNLHIVGPLLAGNIIEGNPVWHVEHCGRIISLSKILSKILYKDIS